MLKANSTHYCFGLTNLLFLFAEINKKTKNKIKNTTTMKISRQNKEKDFKKRLQRTLQILRWLFQWYIALYLCSLTTLHTKYHSLVPSLVHWWMKVKWIWSKHFKHLKEKKKIQLEGQVQKTPCSLNRKRKGCRKLCAKCHFWSASFNPTLSLTEGAAYDVAWHPAASRRWVWNFLLGGYVILWKHRRHLESKCTKDDCHKTYNIWPMFVETLATMWTPLQIIELRYF